MSSVERGCSLECTSRTTISRSSVRAAESLLSGRIQEREYRGRTEMSRKIYNRLSLMAVSWLDESTLVCTVTNLSDNALIRHNGNMFAFSPNCMRAIE